MYNMGNVKCLRCGCPLSYTNQSFVAPYCISCRIAFRIALYDFARPHTDSSTKLQWMSSAEVAKIPRVRLHVGKQKQIVFTMSCSSGNIAFKVYQAGKYVRLVHFAKGTRWN